VKKSNDKTKKSDTAHKPNRAPRPSWEGRKMTRPDSSASTMIMRVAKVLLLLAFVVSIVAIGALTTYYVRRPYPGAYALSGGSGELWLTVIAISALGGFVIVSVDERQKNRKVREERSNSTQS